MMSLWDALRMNMMISYQELVRTFPKHTPSRYRIYITVFYNKKMKCINIYPVFPLPPTIHR